MANAVTIYRLCVDGDMENSLDPCGEESASKLPVVGCSVR